MSRQGPIQRAFDRDRTAPRALDRGERAKSKRDDDDDDDPRPTASAVARLLPFLLPRRLALV